MTVLLAIAVVLLIYPGTWFLIALILDELGATRMSKRIDRFMGGPR